MVNIRLENLEELNEERRRSMTHGKSRSIKTRLPAHRTKEAPQIPEATFGLFIYAL